MRTIWLFMCLIACVPKAKYDSLLAENELLKLQLADSQGIDTRLGSVEDRWKEAYDAYREKRSVETLQLLTAFQKDFPKSSHHAKAEQYIRELELIGTPVEPMEVESWFQGSFDYVDAPISVLVFFEEWCPHCQTEMPEINKLYQEWSSQGIAFAGFTKVTRSSTDDSVMEFIASHSLDFPIAKERDGLMSKQFAISGVPAAVIVKDGMIIWRDHPGRIDEALLESLLKPSR